MTIIDRRNWKKCLEGNCEFLCTYLEIENGSLLNEYLSEGIITKIQFDDVKAQMTHCKKAEKLVDVLHRINQDHYWKVLTILNKQQPDKAHKLADSLGIGTHFKPQQESEASCPTESKEQVPGQMMNLAEAGATSGIAEEVSYGPVVDLQCSETKILPKALFQCSSDAAIIARGAGELSLASSASTQFDITGAYSNFNAESRQHSGDKKDGSGHCGSTFPETNAFIFILNRLEQIENKQHDERVRMEERIMNEFQKMQQSITEVTKDHKTIIDIIMAIQIDIGQLKDDMTELRSEVAKTSQEVHALREEFNGSVRASFRNSNGWSLLIGDQSIRKLCETNLHQTTIICIQKARVSDALGRLNNYRGPFGRLILCIGANDCTDVEFNIEDIVESFVDMVELALQKVAVSILICISSIPPRKDKKRYQKNIDELNEKLSSLAKEHSLTFIDNDLSFKRKNDMPVTYYLEDDDGHLTQDGTNQLAENLELILDPKVTDGNFVE